MPPLSCRGVVSTPRIVLLRPSTTLSLSPSSTSLLFSLPPALLGPPDPLVYPFSLFCSLLSFRVPTPFTDCSLSSSLPLINRVSLAGSPRLSGRRWSLYREASIHWMVSRHCAASECRGSHCTCSTSAHSARFTIRRSSRHRQVCFYSFSIVSDFSKLYSSSSIADLPFPGLSVQSATMTHSSPSYPIVPSQRNDDDHSPRQTLYMYVCSYHIFLLPGSLFRFSLAILL